MTAKLNKIPKIYNYFNYYIKKHLFPIINKKYPYFLLIMNKYQLLYI